jgi:hypothetical protein
MAVTTIDHMKRKRGRCDPAPLTAALNVRLPFSFSSRPARSFSLARPQAFQARRFLRPGSQLRVMVFRVFPCKPIDCGQSICFRRGSDFRSRHDRFPCQPHDNLTDRIGLRSADGLRPDNARVKAGQFLFGQLAGSFDVVVRVSLRSRGRMSVHQQITEACSHKMVVNLTVEPRHINVEFNALPDCH